MFVLMTEEDFTGKTALVTGASMGIGETFARELSRRGAKVVLVARGRERLEALAKELGGATVIAKDLSKKGAATEVLAEVRRAGLEIDLLVNNAGFAAYGPFAAVSGETQREQVDLNCGALVELTHAFLPEITRRKGGVIHVASTAAFQPVPFLAVYAATKAFVLSFSEALWAEYRPRGVRVLALCPGATDTPFFARAGESAALGKKATPEDVVRVGLEAYRKNRSFVVHGIGNTMTSWLARVFTRELVAKISFQLMRPKPSALAEKSAHG